MSSRDEYCPVYRSLDLFGDRWALLVVREIFRGVTRFNELERSLPGISRSTLAQRLRHLEGEAIVTRTVGDDGRATEYGLTDAGRDLMSIIKAINEWGVRWLLPEAGPWDKDPDGLMLWITRHVDLTALPPRRVVIRFELRGKGRRYFWLVLRTGEASLCPEHPGFQEDVFVTSSPPQLYRLVLGRQSLKQAIEEGSVRVEGPPDIIRSLPRWLILRSAGLAIPPAPATARLTHAGQKTSAGGPKPDTGPRSRPGSASGSSRTDGRQTHRTKLL